MHLFQRYSQKCTLSGYGQDVFPQEGAFGVCFAFLIFFVQLKCLLGTNTFFNRSSSLFSCIVPSCVVCIHNLCFNLHVKHLYGYVCQIQKVPVSWSIVHYKVLTCVNMAARVLFWLNRLPSFYIQKCHVCLSTNKVRGAFPHV